MNKAPKVESNRAFTRGNIIKRVVDGWSLSTPDGLVLAVGHRREFVERLAAAEAGKVKGTA